MESSFMAGFSAREQVFFLVAVVFAILTFVMIARNRCLSSALRQTRKEAETWKGSAEILSRFVQFPGSPEPKPIAGSREQPGDKGTTNIVEG